MAREKLRVRLDIYPQQALVEALDRWREKQPGTLMNRAEAARRILDDRLIADGAYKVPRTRKKGAE